MADNIDDIKVEDIIIHGKKDQAEPEPKPDPDPAEEGEEGEAEPEDGEPAEGEEGEAEPGESEPEDGEAEPGEETEEPSDESFDWDAFSEEVGVSVSSDDEIVSSLQELAGYRNLSPAIQKAIEIEKNKGDVAGYFKVLASNPENLSDREALWERFASDNQKLISKNPKFAKLDFDRNMNSKYALLSEYESLSAEDKVDFLAEHKDDIEYLKEKFKVEADESRAYLSDKQKEIKFYEPESGKKEMTQEEADAIVKAHEGKYKAAMSNFGSVSIPLGDDFEFNVGLTPQNKGKVNEWMKNPELFLNELGFSKGVIDYDKLIGWASLIADIQHSNFGERLRQAVIDNKNIDTLEKNLDAPSKGAKGAGSPPVTGDEWDKVGEAFSKKRESLIRRR